MEPGRFRQTISSRPCRECACSTPWWANEPVEAWDIEKDGNVVRLMLDECCDPVFDGDGAGVSTYHLPISEGLMLALERWAHDYTDIGDHLGLCSLVFEYDPVFPMDWFNARGDALAAALQAELGPDWQVEHRPLRRDYSQPETSQVLVDKS